MRINTIERAAYLVRKIAAPSNQEVEPQEGENAGFNPDRTSSIYTMEFAPRDTEYNSGLLDVLYHERNKIFRNEPDDYRIGANNELQADINELVRMFIYNENNTFLRKLLDSNQVTSEQMDKALAVSTVYSGVAEAEFYFQYLRSQKYRFPSEVWSKVAGSGGLAHNEPVKAEKILSQILKVQERAIAYSGSFNQWIHSFRYNEWMFERFLKKINGADATGMQPGDGTSFAYKKYTPAVSGIKGFSIHDFPGAGLVIYGLHSKLFPDKYLPKTFLGEGGAYDEIDYEYRSKIVEGEKHIKDTKFAFFRGGVLVYNPRNMKVNGKPYGLLIYNDHFPKDHLKTAFLVSGRSVEFFMNKPFHGINESNFFHPNSVLNKNELEVKAINLVSLAAQAGFCEEVRDIEFELGQKIVVHNEVTDAALFGIAQLDLLREAYRLYSLGFYYNKKKNNFYKDEFVMLRELLRINRSAAQQSIALNKDVPELPVAFPFTFLEHSVDPVKVSKIGFVGANMIVYRRNFLGDCLLFGDAVTRIDPKDINHISQDSMESMLGGEGLDYWREFLEGNDLFRANPMIVDPVYKKIGCDVLVNEV